jgi:hypothetical protein
MSPYLCSVVVQHVTTCSQICKKDVKVFLQSLVRMMDERGKPNALFFYQLLLPIAEPTKSGIIDDPRMPFYTKAAEQSNLIVRSP